RYISSKSIEETYIKLSPIEHVLKRPDTYVGSVETVTEKQWIYNAEKDKLEYKEINYVPAFLKIFDEILVNAADNKMRDPSMNQISVNIDKDDGQISVYNNGKGIPIEIHKELNVYVPEMLFGQLMTSSNYNDDEKKFTGGRNGLGAKSANIFSTKFTVETIDMAKKKQYVQSFYENMTKTDEPKITAYDKKEEYTKISFNPDFEKLGMSKLTNDTIALLNKRVYDIAGTVKNVKVFLNDKQIQTKNFKEYVQMYLKSINVTDGEPSKTDVVHQQFGDHWEVSIAPSIEGQFQQVSGTHVNHVIDQIVTKLIECIEKKNKDLKVKHFQIKNHIWVFVNCLIENPAFDSQTKEIMTLKHHSFRPKCRIDDNFIKKEDAINAGTSLASNCTLILTEGDSAKALVLAGFDVVGNSNWGVYPLRGKLLNVRDASIKQISENKEIQAIKQILGLQHDKEYNSVKDLRYGKLMIMTDQDHDGSHIKGLIINLFDHFYPSLLKNPDFLCEFITPIVKCKRNKEVISFFTIPEYQKWKSHNDDGKGWEIKYYKGLGTSTSNEAKEYFKNLGKHVKLFKPMDNEDHQLVEMAFAKKNADERKNWIKSIEDGTYIDYTQHEISIKDFINKELSLFSLADNVRSIPSVIDGLKPGQRKVLFGCIKRNLVNEQIKVSQLSGYISEHSAYHHGEASLHSTIIGLAQDFVGSNNINLLEPIGQFGKRNDGGKSAASARYIYTRLAPFARFIFHPDDDVLLDHLNEDGQTIEPKWYVPIIPMVLVNGVDGIGTGWSTNIPNFNPKDIIQNLRRMINDEELIPMHPWYRGFYGRIQKIDENKYVSYGIIAKKGKAHVLISELPACKWTEDYKSKVLIYLMENGFIKNIVRNNCTNERVDLVIELTNKQMEKAESDGLEKFFKLTSSITTSNMMCFNSNNKLVKYESPEEILKEFYSVRLNLYIKRRGGIKFEGLKKLEIVKLLESHKFDKIYSDEIIKGYDYLMGMTCWTFSKEEINKYEEKKKILRDEFAVISGMSAKELWIKDLDALENAWDKFLQCNSLDVDKENRMKFPGITTKARPT
ncbi:11930_t:CDS:2, partial [Entrophospora sp. SA101]